MTEFMRSNASCESAGYSGCSRTNVFAASMRASASVICFFLLEFVGAPDPFSPTRPSGRPLRRERLNQNVCSVTSSLHEKTKGPESGRCFPSLRPSSNPPFLHGLKLHLCAGCDVSQFCGKYPADGGHCST